MDSTGSFHFTALSTLNHTERRLFPFQFSFSPDYIKVKVPVRCQYVSKTSVIC